MINSGSTAVDSPSGDKARRRLSLVPFSALLALAAATASAEPQATSSSDTQSLDTFNFALGAGMRYDDNLFRLSGSEKSDTIYTTNAGIKIDKPYAQQRFQLDAGLIDNKFRSNDFLDYTAFNYRAAWLWHLTPNVSGILLADQNQVLNNFADFRNTQDKSIQTNQTRLFTIDGLIGGGVHLLGGLLDVRSRNSKTFEQVGDYRQDGFELGVKYVAPSENWISIMRREFKGDYRGRVLDPVAQLDTGFDQSETEANLGWRVTGKSEIDAKLGYVDRVHDHFSQRDYSGSVGRLLYRWTPTGKLQLNLSLTRNLFSFQEDVNSYFVADTFSISPIWQYSPKTTLRLKYDYSDRDYRGAIVPTAEMRQDKVQSLLFSADWQATRTLLLTGTLQHDRRSSNIDGFDYDSNAAGINAQLLF